MNHAYASTSLPYDETEVYRMVSGNIHVSFVGQGSLKLVLDEQGARDLCEQIMAVLPPVPAEATTEVKP